MTQYKFDVVIVGAGPAGLAAAGALAGSGISVALLEAGVYAGAENWSGCVYFAESLAAPDCFGPEAVAAAPYERKVVRRGTLLHNGLDVIGLELAAPAVFAGCYTVLRPVYDPYFAHLVRAKGVVHLTGTTVTALIRKKGAVVGVETNRGPLSAAVTFIAEGDASHLVRAEQLERVSRPHFLQGVKAVLPLEPREIEKRFRLNPGDGAAYELLVRNPSIGGRTAKLNIGAFLYTNRDSLSLGYVAPLENIRDAFRGRHDIVYEWLQRLPFIQELTAGAGLSAYGTKIIRSGGWREHPVLAEDGLAVGGSSVGFGVDLPVPNFTGPASATGLYFARAVRSILKRGASFDRKHLENDYLDPLQDSVYGTNARYLSHWPAYFGGSRVLFSRTVDLACGTARFLSQRNAAETGRFLRQQLLSLRAVKEVVSDTARAIRSLKLGRMIATTLFNPATVGSWFLNLVKGSSEADHRPGIVLWISGRRIDAAALPWPVNTLLRRLSPGIGSALAQIYGNDGQPLEKKLKHAVRLVVRRLNAADILILPLSIVGLFFISVGTAVVDAFRFYVLKTPVEKMLSQPAMAYGEAQRRIRDLDGVKPSSSLEAKLATNTYRVGAESHIRTLWPESIPSEPDMAQAGLWWVCPARVYVYDAPPLAGRGRVTVNWENCIKCESCWRAEPDRTLWGRHTGHALIYRPESGALDQLIRSLDTAHSPRWRASGKPELEDPRLWQLTGDFGRSAEPVLAAAAAFRTSVNLLPASADNSRRAWPGSIGKRLAVSLTRLEAAFRNDGRYDQADVVRSEREAFELRLAEGRLFHALYCCRKIEDRLNQWVPVSLRGADAGESASLRHEEVSRLFPDREVKQWEDSSMPEEWARKLRAFIGDHRSMPLEAVRALSSVNPALGLIAAHQLHAARIMSSAGRDASGICAVDGRSLEIRKTGAEVRVSGKLQLVPAAASIGVLVCSGSHAYLVPFNTAGVTMTAMPAIGFRAAGFVEIAFDSAVPESAFDAGPETPVPDAAFYLAIAAGAAGYLSGRVKEHASGRIQFAGQMLDTEGRDGIAKLGAVKALVARIEAWRLLLEHLYGLALHSERIFGLLCSTLAAKAFGPEPGCLGYDAGQVFGGFAYSEDDLLSRFYRDSSLFRFLAPGYGAAAALHAALSGKDLGQVFPEAGAPDDVQPEPLGYSASRLRMLASECRKLPGNADPARAGEAEAVVIGVRMFLVSLERALSRGESSEEGAAAIEVLLGLARDAVAAAALSAGRGSVPPEAVFPVEPAGNPVPGSIDYESFCAASGEPHRSGSFLATVFDRSPRFVPEMQLDDPGLRGRWAELTGWFRKNCSDRLFEGLPIERFIERNHRLPEEVIQAAKEHRWLATYIPKELDGLGWRKAEYYILNSAGGSFGDASIDLLIMASTSIGTTPILLGLEEELARVREELAPLVQDEQRLGTIGARLAKIIATLASPNPGWIRKEYEGVMQLVDARIRRTRVVKYLAANFLKTFYAAGIAGRRGDFAGFSMNLKRSEELFARLMPDVRAALQELPLRERCHRRFLRALGHGAVSAFALTEPTAGSDSGGVKTTAKLLRSVLTPLEDGRYSFAPFGRETESRYLIDADRLVFASEGPAYRTPDGQEQPIRFDRYDYRTDQGERYYRYQGKDCPFHDIAEVRKSSEGLFYEYYSLTGAKMWITNGSIATQFCLYAQTAEGVTGFLVDRHSEGLKVGADEKKTGQRGSPTNEISIDSVRVPREAVIGYEGHGQVNALETLNVGRCGLAVVSGALMRKLMQEARAALPPSPGRDSLLGEAAAVLFGSESLAYYLVGLFDRPHESVRMESAIAKYACSEDIHELITLVEQAFGPIGQTERYLLEKARRDSRILTIYEGTNEVQRFLILKDLIAEAGRWPELPGGQQEEPDRSLAVWKNLLRSRVREAAGLLGDTSWSDAMLQPAFFPLSEMAGEILRLECIWYRLEMLEARSARSGQEDAYHARMIAAGRRALSRTLSRLEFLDRKYGAAWEIIKNSRDLPEVRLADAALDRYSEKKARTVFPAGRLEKELRILSIVRPVADLSPRPRLDRGRLNELVRLIDPADMAALSQVFTMKANSSARVVVDVLMPGTPADESLLRAAAGGRADRLIRLSQDRMHDAAALAEAVRDLEKNGQYHLIAAGAASLDADRTLGAYLAGRLARPYSALEQFEVEPGGASFRHITLPAIVGITGSAPVHPATITETVAGFFAPVIDLQRESRPEFVRFALPSGARAVQALCTDPAGAARYLSIFAESASTGTAPDYTGTPAAVPSFEAGAVHALLEPRNLMENMPVLRAAAFLADQTGKKAHAVIPAPRSEWPALLGAARANGCQKAYCIDTGEGMLSGEGKHALIRRIGRDAGTTVLIAGMGWEAACARAAGELAGDRGGVLVASGVTEIQREASGNLVVSLPAYDGRLVRQHAFLDGPALLMIAPEGEFPEAAKQENFDGFPLDFGMSPGMAAPLPPISPLALPQADVIIDLGYGIRDQAGLVLAQELKKKLEELGFQPLFGATRKVTQDLKLLPLEAQIGQTGVRVNPKLIIALGISGAPQHIDYVGTRAEILCFNKDSEAPLMKLNQSRPAPRVHPILGDLFITVRELIDRLGAGEKDRE